MILLCWKVHIWKYGLTYRKWSLDDCQIKCWSFSVEREHYRMVNWPCYKTFTQKLPPARHRRLLPPKIEWQSNGLAHACMWWVIVVDLVFHLCLCVSVCAMPLIRIVGICCCCCYWFEWREKKQNSFDSNTLKFIARSPINIAVFCFHFVFSLLLTNYGHLDLEQRERHGN